MTKVPMTDDQTRNRRVECSRGAVAPLVILWSLPHWLLVVSALFSTSENPAENEVKFLRFAPERASLLLQTRLRGRSHAQEKLCLLRLLFAGANLVDEFLLRHRLWFSVGAFFEFKSTRVQLRILGSLILPRLAMVRCLVVGHSLVIAS